MDIQANSSGGAGKYLTFAMAGEFYAIEISSVREVLDMTDITRIPTTPEFMLGVVNLRGNAVPVIDLRLKFGLEKTERTINTRIIIMEINMDDEVWLLGAMADSVKEVLEIEASMIDPPPKMGTSIRTDFLSGLAKHDGRFILLLDTAKVFSMEELSAIQDAGGSIAA